MHKNFRNLGKQNVSPNNYVYSCCNTTLRYSTKYERKSFKLLLTHLQKAKTYVI